MPPDPHTRPQPPRLGTFGPSIIPQPEILDPPLGEPTEFYCLPYIHVQANALWQTASQITFL